MRLALVLCAAALGAGAVVAAVELAGGHRTAALSACARAGAAIDRPATIPRAFPLPAGTVLTRSFRNRTSHGVPAVEGLVPLGLDDAVRFFHRELPHAGMKIVMTFTKESGFEAFYAVKGFSGRYRIDELSACPDASSLVITARPTLLGRGFSE
jgi:hypothetical protein